MKKIFLILAISLLSACAHNEYSTSQNEPQTEAHLDEYGYSPSNPIKVGNGGFENGPLNEKMFLSSLRGPNGETVEFRRLGSCCEFETPNGFLGGGLLDQFEVFHEGLEKPIILYINMYDPGELKSPKGFVLY